MRNRFDRQLEQLNNELIQMGSMIEHAIEMAVSALVNQDTEKAKKAMAYDVEIDHQERDIESLCMKLFIAAAAGSKRFASDFCSIKDDYRYGANR